VSPGAGAPGSFAVLEKLSDAMQSADRKFPAAIGNDGRRTTRPRMLIDGIQRRRRSENIPKTRLPETPSRTRPPFAQPGPPSARESSRCFCVEV